MNFQKIHKHIKELEDNEMIQTYMKKWNTTHTNVTYVKTLLHALSEFVSTRRSLQETLKKHQISKGWNVESDESNDNNTQDLTESSTDDMENKYDEYGSSYQSDY